VSYLGFIVPVEKRHLSEIRMECGLDIRIFTTREALDALPNFSIAFIGSLLELVALSRGYTLHQVCRDLGECPKSFDRYEYSNVLWIKRGNGVAYRQRLGLVLKSIWESQSLEIVEVVLS
jgi:hypothetical protein